MVGKMYCELWDVVVLKQLKFPSREKSYAIYDEAACMERVGFVFLGNNVNLLYNIPL